MSLKSLSIPLFLFLLSIDLSFCWAPYPLFVNSIYDYTRPDQYFPNKREFSFNLGNPEEFRNAVYEICRYTFAGAWDLITAQQMRFHELKGRSLKDRWYYCGLPPGVQPLHREYGEATVVFYGPGRRHPESMEKVAAVSAYFSQKQAQQFSTLLTPRLLGTFPGGRVEEFWSVLKIIKLMN